MRKVFGLVIVLMLSWACGSKQDPKAIYIVRHAEKLLVGDDPQLSVAGNARAVKLAQILENLNIEHVFSTNTIRTKATVQPFVQAKGLTIEDYDAKNHDDLVSQLRELKGNAVVVGHSNTIHHLANYFVGSGEQYPELEDDEYNYIFIVNVNADGTSGVERKVYKDF